MNFTELALLIGAIAAVGGVISNARRIDELQKALAEERRQRQEEKRIAQQQNDLARTNIILLGESMGSVRSDNAKMALLINQLFNQFETATGHKPDIDINMIKHLRTLEYVTGPLGPLDIPDRYR